MHHHSDHVPDAPLARDSLDVCISLWGTDRRWLDHSLVRRVGGISVSSLVACMKLLLDFIRSFGTVWSCSGCLVSLTCSASLFVQKHFSLKQWDRYQLVDKCY